MSASGTTYPGKVKVQPRRLAHGQAYCASVFSSIAVEAAQAAWQKLDEGDRASLQAIIDRIIEYQTAENLGRNHKTPTIANSGIELLAKLGWYLNGVDYVKYVYDALDERKGTKK